MGGIEEKKGKKGKKIGKKEKVEGKGKKRENRSKKEVKYSNFVSLFNIDLYDRKKQGRISNIFR